MEKETYLAQGYCKNCGRENYPQWGSYEIGKKLENSPCPNCGCMTWVLDIRSHTPEGTTHCKDILQMFQDYADRNEDENVRRAVEFIRQELKK